MVSGYLQGGLGNQLFIMASAFAYAKNNDRMCVIYTPAIVPNPHTKQLYEYTVFASFPKIDFPEPDIIIKEHNFHCMTYIPLPVVDPTIEHCLLQGYFQTARYLGEHKQAFIRLLSLPFDQVNWMYKTCFLHVRRNDYLKIQLHNVDLSKYYPRAINLFLEKHPFVHFHVVSDDIGWCKEQELFRQISERVSFEDQPDETKALVRMAKCELGGICPNSTFSWWAGFLNPNPEKIIIMPNTWFNDPQMIVNDISFENVIVLDVQ